jgi:hypothetical protein
MFVLLLNFYIIQVKNTDFSIKNRLATQIVAIQGVAGVLL